MESITSSGSQGVKIREAAIDLLAGSLGNCYLIYFVN